MKIRTIKVALADSHWKKVDRIMSNMPNEFVRNSMAGMLIMAGVKFMDECQEKGLEPESVSKFLFKTTKGGDSIA